MAEITRKSVLLECLSIMREEQRICSKGYNSLEPAKGMEEAWEQGRVKIRILQEIIQALDSEPVLRALANWQKEELPPMQLTIEEGTTAGRVMQRISTGEADKKDNGTGYACWYEAAVEVPEGMDPVTLFDPLGTKERLDREDGTMELR